MGKAIIREGDSTSHGGTVLEAFPTLTVYGKNAAGVGHQVSCPKCKGNFPIVAGAANYTFMGKNVAVDGMQTACGAVLIASQGQATVDNTPGAAAGPASVFGAPARVATGALAALMFNDKFRLVDQDGKPYVNTKYAIHINGAVVEGVTDENGHTDLLASEAEAHDAEIHLEGMWN
ncbi:PAAR domain-containing protein [Chromobacterium phragmitis]|uniref:PAAR domain-containing protein n=1 Tax=Chromobacterium amazonense TaxID=1382803 RepID=UPI0021B78BB3|nr:PAAR domain-containing protein [Chromobacterium amazonense]MBM2886496.1 PAAR domain-containing protein [Chromobacterium amazonense]